MPYKFYKRLAIVSYALIITACYGSRETAKTSTVYSTPSYCSHLTAPGVGFCTNFKNSEKSIEHGGSLSFGPKNIDGFSPDWGTQYEVTFLQGHDDEKSPLYKELLDYEVTSLDPVGTTYTYTYTDHSRASISRTELSDTGYSFLGYDVICDDSTCHGRPSSIESATFKLVEKDGERMIEVVELIYLSSSTDNSPLDV